MVHIAPCFMCYMVNQNPMRMRGRWFQKMSFVSFRLAIDANKRLEEIKCSDVLNVLVWYSHLPLMLITNKRHGSFIKYFYFIFTMVSHYRLRRNKTYVFVCEVKQTG